MSKAIQGAALIAGAVGIGVAEFALASTGVGTAALPFLTKAMFALAASGISMEAGAIAGALTSNRGMAITTRQAAAFRQVVRGHRRVGGIMVYKSTTGSTHNQINYVIVIAGHPVQGITGLYLDGRLVYWQAGGSGNTTNNGYNFGGTAAGGSHTGPDGVQYDFGGKVYCHAYYGQQGPYDIQDDLTANDPNWAPVNGKYPYGGGCTWVYLKRQHDTTLFPNGDPEIKFTVAGKNDIYDPRTRTYGFTDNWALNVADHIRDPLSGFGDHHINDDALIAAANICDEAVPVASQGVTEKRYVISANYDTSMSPGSILQKMMGVAAGRVRHIGGEWNIFPGAWQGPAFNFGPEALSGGVQSSPVLGIDELCNQVTGTYTAPNYPYNVSGDLYDSNGFYQGQTQNNWPFAWQPTDFPRYARDPLHGYAVAEDLNQDSGVQAAWASGQSWNEDDVVTHNGAIWKSLVDTNTTEPTADPANGNSQYWTNGALVLSKDLNLDWVISVTQAQRLAKIELMRTRFQGRYRLPMFLSAYSMQPLDVMNLTLPALGWAGKTLEIDMPVLQAVRTSDDGPPALQVMVPVAETDPSIYAWSPVEEHTVGSAPATPTSNSGTVQPPTNVQLLSSAATAVTQPDGTIVPRIQVSWATPLDAYVVRILLRYRVTGSSAWIDAGSVDVNNNTAFIAGVVAGQSYDVGIASQRSSGATSVYVEIDNFGTSLVLSASSSDTGIGPGSIIGVGKTDGTAYVQFKPFTTSLGGRNLSYFPGGSQFVMGLQQKTKYYGYVVDQTLSGGDLTAQLTLNPADYRGKPGYYFIDSVVTPAVNTSGSGGVYYPSSAQDTSDSTTQSSGSAYDGNSATCATVSASFYCQKPLPGDGADPQSFSGGCLFKDFPAVQPNTTQTLSVDVEVTTDHSGGLVPNHGGVTITVTVGNTTSTLMNVSDVTARNTYTMQIPANTALNTVTVQVSASPPFGGNTSQDRYADINANVYEITISS